MENNQEINRNPERQIWVEAPKYNAFLEAWKRLQEYRQKERSE